MSHFTVLVIGDNPEKQLAPYQEYDCQDDFPEECLEFENIEEEYRKKYDTESRKIEYCESHSSWGMELSEENFTKIKNIEVGESIDLELKGKGMHYFTEEKLYNCYYPIDGKRSKDDFWVRVSKVLETNHPDRNICFEGKIKVMKTSKPNDIPLKEYYPNFPVFLKEYAGYEKDKKNGEYGYWHNPNSKWDYYRLGGRWNGYFKLKEEFRNEGKVGEASWDSKEAETMTTDQAKKEHIDFSLDKEEYKKAQRFWEIVIEDSQLKEGEEEPFNMYKKSYYLERFKTKEFYAKTRAGPSTYAVVKDGIWYKKGEMGWFGCGSDSAKESHEWDKDFYNKWIKELPEDTLLSVFDCHI